MFTLRARKTILEISNLKNKNSLKHKEKNISGWLQ